MTGTGGSSDADHPPFAAHTLSSRLTGIEYRLSPAALTFRALALGLLACALPLVARLLFTHVRRDGVVAYVVMAVVLSYLLILLTEVNYFGRAWYFTLLYAASAIALCLFSWTGHTADVLDARGRSTEVTVTGVTQRPKHDATCKLSRADGTVLPQHLRDGCSDLRRGATLTVIEDPEGEVGPQTSAPSTSGTYAASGIAGVILVGAVTWAGSAGSAGLRSGRRTREGFGRM
ncbi:hypothetical protein GCM10009837_64170 [Streptomyces durmitorensis]|uniref:Integral membrane protein n=1 Tax=Streptomyces durmitorensis TaxID=319947 RepID=A0ABY4PT68_9ACTN|nr:hypothetical protein [Streptomyces durmitorensis]UQT57032.1 hypothetical protein M4V62_19055 [Streptomyces durmitorensis]